MDTDEDFEILSGVLFRIPLDILAGTLHLPVLLVYFLTAAFLVGGFCGIFYFLKSLRLGSTIKRVFFFIIPLVIVIAYTFFVFVVFDKFKIAFFGEGFALSNIGWLVKYPALGSILNYLMLLSDMDFLFSIRIIQFIFSFFALLFFYRILCIFVDRRYAFLGSVLLAVNPIFLMSASLGVKVGCVSFSMVAAAYFLLRFFSDDGSNRNKRDIFFVLSMSFLIVGILLKEPMILFAFFCIGMSLFYVVFHRFIHTVQKKDFKKRISIISKGLMQNARGSLHLVLLAGFVLILAIRRQLIQKNFIALTLKGGYDIQPERIFDIEIYNRLYEVSEIIFAERLISLIVIFFILLMLFIFFRKLSFKYVFIPAWVVFFILFTIITRFTFNFKSLVFYIPPTILILVWGLYYLGNLPRRNKFKKVFKISGVVILLVYILFVFNYSWVFNNEYRRHALYPIDEYYGYVSGSGFEDKTLVQFFSRYYIYEYYLHPQEIIFDWDFFTRHGLDTSGEERYGWYRCNFVVDMLKEDSIDYISIRVKRGYNPVSGLIGRDGEELNDLADCILEDSSFDIEKEFFFEKNKIILIKQDID